MNETTIKRHNFDSAKNRLKEFTEKTEAELKIDEVQTDGGFLGLGDHKVTGSELNKRLATIQKHFIAVNTTNNEMIEIFREVYKAFDALDEDYVKWLVSNVLAIKKTSDDVRKQQDTLRQHNEKLEKQQSKLDAHQDEIKKNVVNISKIVTALKVFKEKLESYKHLTDIDKIWNDCKIIKNEIESIANLLRNQIPVVQETASFAEHLKSVVHIDDVDSMWDDINKVEETLGTIEKKLQNVEVDIFKMQKHIDALASFVTILNGCAHLQDIDNMWDDLDVCKTSIEKTNEDIQMHQKELDVFATINAEYKESMNTLFKKLTDVEEYAVKSRNLITELEFFRTKISVLNHLMEVDEIWKQVENHQIRIRKVEQESTAHTDKLNDLVQADDKIRECIDSNVHDINSLKDYKDKLSGISHLDDVDSIWKAVEEHTSWLIKSEKKDEELIATIQKNKDEADKNIEETVHIANAAIESLTRKLKYVYWIAGGSAGLAIVELILLLKKVI